MNPETRQPERDRFTWNAPGGSGSHSLPGDFQPSAIEPLRGRRVLLLVGPNSDAAPFQRGIPGTRSFGTLPASIRVKLLSSPEVEDWLSAVEAACRS